MSIKKTIISIAICTLFSGCALTEMAKDTYTLKTYFDSDFEYSIEHLNTYEDNKKLLNEIESDKNLMEALKRNREEGKLAHSEYLNYQNLKKKIEEYEKELLKEKNKKIKKEKTRQKEIKDNFEKKQLELEKQEKIKKQKEFEKQEKIKKQKELEKQKNIELEKQRKKERIAAEKEIALQKEQEEAMIKAQKDADSFIKKDLRPSIYILRSHCNDEDAYLILDDFNSFKNKVISYTDKKEIQFYIFDQFKEEFDKCLSIYYDNNMPN
tara:strand:+ start:33514 stop:34314 length:801 start_codon:yes stop_codon:yes gene_type:complete